MSWESFVLPGVTNYWGFLFASVLYCACFVCLWGLINCTLLCAGFSDVVKDIPRGTWALKLQNLIHHCVVSPLALLALLDDPTCYQLLECFGCAESSQLFIRDPSGPSFAAMALTPVTIGFMMSDLVLLGQWNRSAKTATESDLLIFHHVGCIVAWPVAIACDFCSRYVLVLLGYEFSSIFLAINWLLSNAGHKQGIGYLLSGLLFTSSFVLIRMVGALPQLRAMFLGSQPWMATAEEYPDISNVLVLRIVSVTLVVPHILNIFWGVKVIQGSLAIVLGKGNKAGAPGDGSTEAREFVSGSDSGSASSGSDSEP